MKDNRANIKIKKETRDRLMRLKYELRIKNIDELLNEFIDEYWLIRGGKNE